MRKVVISSILAAVAGLAAVGQQSLSRRDAAPAVTAVPSSVRNNAKKNASAPVIPGVSAAEVAAAAPSAEMTSDFDILLRRSIFVPKTQRPRQDPPESRYVLRGTATEDGQIVAFFEDLRSGRTQVIHPGDELARGVIATIALGQVEYELDEAADDDEPARIVVGQTLAGVMAPAVAVAVAPPQATAQAPASPDANMNGMNPQAMQAWMMDSMQQNFNGGRGQFGRGQNGQGGRGQGGPGGGRGQGGRGGPGGPGGPRS